MLKVMLYGGVWGLLGASALGIGVSIFSAPLKISLIYLLKKYKITRVNETAKTRPTTRATTFLPNTSSISPANVSHMVTFD